MHVSLAASMAGDADLALKHATIFGETMGEPGHPWVLGLLLEGYLLKGETDRALEVYAKMRDRLADWFLDCIRARDDPGMAPALVDAMQETMRQYRSGELNKTQQFWRLGQVISCGTWLKEPDLVFEVLLNKDSTVFFGGPMPTEVIFINMFDPDGGVLRKDPRFHELVVETGLLDYWRQWGWSDYCEPDGDSFRCN